MVYHFGIRFLSGNCSSLPSTASACARRSPLDRKHIVRIVAHIAYLEGHIVDSEPQKKNQIGAEQGVPPYGAQGAPPVNADVRRILKISCHYEETTKILH